MLFSSITFLVFFLPCVLLIYYYIPSIKYRNIFLLAASLLFYAWGEPRFVLIMIFSILLNYRVGLILGDLAFKQSAQRLALALAILGNVGVLVFFKYLNFASTILNHVLKGLSVASIPYLDIIMPIGISFYTFHAISYLVDVYREPRLVQKNLLNLGLYITCFAQLVAGPIIRYHDVSVQILERKHSPSMFADGVERFIIGLGKKVLLANTFGKVADGIYALSFDHYGTGYSWIAIIAYTLQIYYDFSGYSCMALGIGKMFGFTYLENFNYPYISTSLTEFWRRWHISLSSWFKDYLYIPLGGNRKGVWRQSINLYIVFFTTGLWHGASLSFIIWGLGHGTLLFIEKQWSRLVKIKQSIFTIVLARLYTLTAVMLLWVFFRNGTRRSIKIILKMFCLNYSQFSDNPVTIVNDPRLYVIVDIKFYLFLVLGVLCAIPWKQYLKMPEIKAFKCVAYIAKPLFLMLIFVLAFASLANGVYNPFIYFRF